MKENSNSQMPVTQDMQQPVSPEPVSAPVAPNTPPPFASQALANESMGAKPQVKPKLNLQFPKLLKKIKILLGFAGFLFVLVLITAMIPGGRDRVQKLLPKVEESPLPVITPIGEVLVPSPYANDPEVLSIVERLSSFDRLLTETVVREDNLRLPNLDWEINFKK